MNSRRRIGTGFVFALATLFAMSAWPAMSGAAATIDTFAVTTSTTQAGGHPDLDMSFSLQSPGSPESAKDVSVNTPGGVFGNPSATTRCSALDFALDSCPSSSQVGLITIRANYQALPNKVLGTAPIFNREPGADQTALFAFVVPQLDIPISLPVAVRTGSDFGLRFTVVNLTQTAPLAGAEITFWGFPADQSHDAERFAKGTPGNPPGCPAQTSAACIATPTPASIAVEPLTINPSICTGAPLEVSLAVTTYQDRGATATATSSYPPTTGCYDMTFKPVLQAAPTTVETDSASGLDLTMRAPQPLGKATTPSPIRSATLDLPEGFTINPDAADGQGACADAEANFGSESAAACPDQAKIGTFAVESSALETPLVGAVYIGEPKPDSQYRLFLIADGLGIHAKFEAEIVPDPDSGHLVAALNGLPQVPFEEFQLHLFAGDRGLMATPTHCSLYPVSARFLPWNDALADVTSTQFFNLSSGPHGSGCPGPVRSFTPRLAAGTTIPVAGAFSDFHLKLDRDDGDQFIGNLGFVMPPGFTGSLRGLGYCSDAAIAAAAETSGTEELASPSCPPTSQVGTTNVAAGPGSHPFHALGRVFLSGPFDGSPLSLVAITPALAGPYDYGTIVVRVAIDVDPLTAQVSAATDRIPQIVGGVPIRMRSIQVSLTRENFTLNPTNCAALSVDSQGIGDQGTVAAFSSYFNAVNCSTLEFAPKMAITQLGGKKKTKRAQNPPLRFDLWTRDGDANLRSLALTLPKSFQIDQRHLGNICSKSELVSKHCAGRQPIGSAYVETPLLDQPLRGPAFAVSGYGKLPHLVFILDGQVTVMPEGQSASISRGKLKGSLKTDVPVIPDVPVGHFRLDLLGGKQGYIANTRDLCVGNAPLARVHFDAQSGRASDQKVKVKVACGKKQHHRPARRFSR